LNVFSLPLRSLKFLFIMRAKIAICFRITNERVRLTRIEFEGCLLLFCLTLIVILRNRNFKKAKNVVISYLGF
jgi:hypothetical protein